MFRHSSWMLLVVALCVCYQASAFPATTTTGTTRSISPTTVAVRQHYGLRQLQSSRSPEHIPSSGQTLGFLRRKNHHHKTVMGHLLGASILLSSAGWASPTIAVAATDNPALLSSDDVTVLNHEYLDPLHPQCRRTIQVDKDGKTFHYSGTGVGSKDDTVLRGCSPGEIQKYGLRTGSFDGQIIMPGLQLSVGDGIHEGKWEPANSVTTTPNNLQFKAVDGIRWNDGNKWIVKDETPKPLTTVVGEWIFLAYIGFSTLAGVKGVVDKIQEKKNRAAS